MERSHLKEIIEEQIKLVKSNGYPVIVRGQGTVEINNHNFDIVFDGPIDLLDVIEDCHAYYDFAGMSFDEIIEKEKKEYEKVTKGIKLTFKKLQEDLYTRQAIWVSPWCISMVHFLVRNGIIHCFVKFRSSNVVEVLASDLYQIITCLKDLQDKLEIYLSIIHVNVDSLHYVVVDDVSKIKLSNEKMGD